MTSTVKHNAFGSDARVGGPRRSVNRLRRGDCPDYPYEGTSYAVHPQRMQYCVPVSHCPPPLCRTQCPTHCPPAYTTHCSGISGTQRGVNAAHSAQIVAEEIRQRDDCRRNNRYVDCAAQGTYVSHMEVVPRQGVSYPRTSIGLGHPSGPLSQCIDVRAHCPPSADLSPLLPGRIPPTECVLNPADGDRFHRTSVYAASGVPMDMPAYAGARSWGARLRVGRP